MSINSNYILYGGVALAVYMWCQTDQEPDYRKMDSSKVNQYQVGPYQRSYGVIPYTDPNSKWAKFRDKMFGSPQELVFNPAFDRRSTNRVPF